MRHVLLTIAISTALGLAAGVGIHAAQAQPVVSDAGPDGLGAASSPGVADPGPASSASTSPGWDEIVEAARAALAAGGWLAVLGLLVSLGVRLGRPWLARHVAWFSTPLGGYAFTFMAALLASAGDAWAGGAGLSPAVLGAALVAGLASLGLTPGQDARSQAARK